MDNKYLKLLAKEYPTIDSVASEMVNLSAIRSLPKGTEYFFSDLHGEYEAFLHMLKSASGIIKKKIDLVFGKTVSNAEREALASLIYYPEKEIKALSGRNLITDEWKRLTIYRLILICESVSAKYTRSRVRKPLIPLLIRNLMKSLSSHCAGWFRHWQLTSFISSVIFMTEAQGQISLWMN